MLNLDISAVELIKSHFFHSAFVCSLELVAQTCELMFTVVTGGTVCAGKAPVRYNGKLLHTLLYTDDQSHVNKLTVDA